LSQRRIFIRPTVRHAASSAIAQPKSPVAFHFEFQATWKVSNFVQTRTVNERIDSRSSCNVEVSPHRSTPGQRVRCHARFSPLPL
jgi:hypothetical protein